MPRQLKPCGTNAAWERHRRRGEPIDDACRAAHRAQIAAEHRAARAKPADLPPCTECGGPRKPRQGAHKWCGGCYQRWLNAGRPADGPPPVGARTEGRREDYRWLRSNGEPITAAASRVGITEKTARKWETAA